MKFWIEYMILMQICGMFKKYFAFLSVITESRRGFPGASLITSENKISGLKRIITWASKRKRASEGEFGATLYFQR